MRCSTVSLLAVTAGLQLATAEDSKTWAQWSSPAPPAPPERASWTDRVTTIQYVPTTIYNTVTGYVTITGPTTTETQTETEYKTITQVNTVIETPAPVTVVSVETRFQTLTQTQTIENSVLVTSTIVNTATVRETATVNNEVTATVQQTATVNNEVTATITSISALTEYVSASSCSSQLTGLVTCPTRIINPTYTPPTPLPSNYLWGCPPGSLCRPKKENCNFEQNPPNDTYVCAPEQCLPVADLPPLETYLDYENVNDTCAWLTPVDDYFNLNPLFFGLDFGIFEIYGQPTCSPAPPASTATVEVPSPTTVTIPSETAVTVSSPTTLTVPSPTTVTVTVTATISILGSPAALSSASSAGWGNWQASHANSAPPHVTPRAELSERSLDKKAVAVASQCYAVCNYAAMVYQSIGRVPELCDSDGQWSSAFSRVTSCTDRYTATGVLSVASVLNEPILYCRQNPSKRTVAEQLLDMRQESSATTTTASSQASSAVSSAASSASSAGSGSNTPVPQTNSSFFTFMVSVLALFFQL